MNTRHQPTVRLACALLAASMLVSCGDGDSAVAPVARIAFLADVSRSFDAEDPERICLAAFDRVLAHAAATRGTVSVELINATPLAASRTPIDIRFSVASEFENNPVYSEPLLQRQRAVGLDQLRVLYEAGPTERGTDVLGALELGERILSRPSLGIGPEQRYLVACGDMLGTEPPLDLYHQQLDEQQINQTIAQLQEAGELPTGLAGSKVYLVGAGQPAAGEMPAERLRGVEAFYRQFFQTASADLVTYSGTLPSFP